MLTQLTVSHYAYHRDRLPFPYDVSTARYRTALVVIDMQRDFVQPGGFGASLGNDVSLLTPIIPTLATLIATFRMHGLPVIHTREGHKADLSDCPPAKRNAANRAGRRCASAIRGLWGAS